MTDYSSEEFWKGAPEGATHYLPVVSDYGYDACWYKQDADGDWRGCNAGNYARSGHEPWSLDCDEVEVFTRYLIKRPDAELSSTGLPPVGTRCEVLNNDLSNAEWEQCTILFSGKHRIVYDSESCSERVGYRDYLQFRPIKTPAQIVAEEREAAIQKMMAVFPLVASEHEICAALYDAGYRKGDDK